MKIPSIIKRHAGADNGNIVILTAITFPLVLFVVAVALNVSEMNSNRSKLNDAADSAIIAAVKAGANELSEGRRNGWKRTANRIGRETFRTNLQGKANLSKTSLHFDLKFIDRNMVSGDLTYRAKMPTVFSKLLGRDEVIISKTVNAKNGFAQFARLTFLVDVSQSMGVAADKISESRLSSETGCAFACHYDTEKGSKETLSIARSLDVNLRIDTVKDSIKTMVSQIENSGALSRYFEVGLYGFSTSTVTYLEPTNNTKKIYNEIDKIDLTNQSGSGGTNLHQSLKELGKIIPKAGSGTNPNSRLSYVIIMTDGVENSLTYTIDGSGNSNKTADQNFQHNTPNFYVDSNEQMQPFSKSACDELKMDGHIVMFLNPTYLIPGGSHSRDRFDFIEDELMPKIVENAKECGSSEELVHSVESEAEILKSADFMVQNLLAGSIYLGK